MKKVLYTCLLVLLFTSCSHDCNEPTLWNFVDIQVSAGDWMYTNRTDNNYYFVEVSVPELTKTIFDAGLVKCYRDYNFGTNNAARQELPCVIAKEFNADSGEKFFYTETIDYEYGIGYVRLMFSVSDFDYDASAPGNEHFRLVLQH